ncbi:MAG TPA: DUF192 domain-containing protein [Clostridia bacterium]|nr:DUF192 domain-containing protein [Clostridia bacterium]
MATVKKGDTVIINDLEIADSFFKRLLGLMYRKSMGENHGLLLVPCNQIHTFGMKFPIDALFLSCDYVIIQMEKSIKPHKVLKTVKNSNYVLELPAGKIEKFGLGVGDKLVVQ